MKAVHDVYILVDVGTNILTKFHILVHLNRLSTQFQIFFLAEGDLVSLIPDLFIEGHEAVS